MTLDTKTYQHHRKYGSIVYALGDAGVNRMSFRDPSWTLISDTSGPYIQTKILGSLTTMRGPYYGSKYYGPFREGAENAGEGRRRLLRTGSRKISRLGS